MNTNKILTVASVLGVVFVFLLVIKMFGVSFPLYVTSTNVSSEFSVVGQGKVEVKPDTVFIDLGVSTNNSATPQEAQKTLTQVNNGIITILGKMDVPKSNIQTSNFSIYPNYGPTGQEITGYNGNVTLTVKLSDASKVGTVIEQATQAGANQVQNTRYEVENPDAYRQKARDEAIKNAKEQASMLSKTLGIKLGRVTNLIEASGDGPVYPMYDRSTGMGGGGGATQFEPGTQTITSIVTLYYEKH